MQPFLVLLPHSLPTERREWEQNWKQLRRRLAWQQNIQCMKRKVDVDMLNAIKSVLADVLSVSPSSEQGEALFLNVC